MKKKSALSGWWGWIGFVALFLIVNEIDNTNYQSAVQSINTENVIPPPISGKVPLFYSNIRGVWVYNESVGAKASQDANEPYYNSEDDIEKYLRKHIPAYRKKSYWGNEWDIPDLLFDDEGDDSEQEEDNHIKK